MVINDEEDAAYNLSLANKTDTVDEIIVVMGTGGVAARYDEGALLQADGVAGQGRAAAYHHLSQGVVDGNHVALIDRLLVHSIDTYGPFPTLPLFGEITQVVGHGMEFHIQFWFSTILFELLTAVLLIAYDGLQITCVEIQ